LRHERHGETGLHYAGFDDCDERQGIATQKYSTFDELVLRVGRGAELKPYFVKQEPLRVELENFIACVKGAGGKSGAKPIASGEDGLRALAR